jgi:hypothetical protein
MADGSTSTLTNPITGTGTSGQVAYWNGTNTQTGSNNLFWDATNNRLGIGTNAPAVNMHLSGVSSNFRITNTTNSNYIDNGFPSIASGEPALSMFTTGITNGRVLQRQSTTNNIFIGDIDSNSGSLIFRTNGTDKARMFTTGNLVLQNGGTFTDNSYRLDVQGISNFEGNTRLGVGFRLQFNNDNVGVYRNANSLMLAGFGGIEFQSSATTMTSQTIRMKLFDTGNLLIQSGGTFTDAGFRLDVNGTARVQGNTTITGAITATATGHRLGNLQILTSGSAGATGQGIVITGLDQTFQLQGSGHTGLSETFRFMIYTGVSSTQQLISNDKAFVRLYGGFTDGNINNLSGNQLWLSPTYNFAGTRTGIIVRGIYYDPTLTSMTGVTHRAIETTTGDVLLCTTSGNVAIGTTTLGTATKLTLGGSQTASSAIARGGLINTTLVAAANNDVLVGLDINPTFTNGAFTSVRNYAARFNGNISVGTKGQWTTYTGANYIFLGNSSITGLNGSSGGDLSFLSNAYYNGTNVVYAASTNFATGFALNQNGTIQFYVAPSGAAGTTVSFTQAAQIFNSGNLLVGTGTTDAGFRLDVNGTTRVQGNTNITGALGIGSTSLATTSLRVSRNGTGGTAYLAIDNQTIFQSDVTATAVGYNTFIGTQATTFTLNALNHYRATQGTFGAGSTITNQFGFLVDSTLIGATNNYGFFGAIASGTNRWNLFMNGTADNYLAGNLGIGTTTIAARLTVVGATTVIGQTNVSARFSDNVESTLLISHPASTGNTATITGNNQLAFSTGTVGNIAERMRINSTGSVGVGVSSINASARLQVDSTTQGFLPPRMTTTQRTAISSPAAGLVVYDTTLNVMTYYNGTLWILF